MKILITGSSGFIGQQINTRLHEHHDVSGCDLVKGGDIRKLTKDDLKGVKVIFHTAAQPKVPLSVEKPEWTHDHNINGTLNLLMRAKEAGVKRVVYSSSSSVYGDQKKLPLKEDMKPNPMSPYAVQKLTGEHYMKVFSDLYGIETVSLRYFNVYGDTMPDVGSYSACLRIFMDKAGKEPLPVFGGSQTRDFTYIGDVVQANLLAMEKGSGVYNIGGGKNYSIKKLAETLSDDINYLPPRKGEPHDTRACIKKAKKELGWQPTTDVIQWLKEVKS